MITTVLLAALAGLVFIFLYKILFRHSWKYDGIPAVAGRLPLVGNVFDMTKTHLVLTEWAKTYGSVFRFNLFGEEIVVLNSFEAIHEALVTNGSDVAGRPHMYRTEHADRNRNSIVWQTYTPKLQFLRKTVHSSLRMYGSGLGKLQYRCVPEIHQMVDRIRKFNGSPFDPWNIFYDSACNIMLDLAFGKRLDYSDENLEKLKEINRLFNHTFGPGSSRIVDGLQWLNVFKNKEFDTMKKALELRNTFWSEYRQKEPNPESIVSDLQTAAGNPKYEELDVTESTMKETFTNLILAGTDTTTTALTCFLLVLQHHPEIQDRLHDELDHVISTSRSPSLLDRVKMPYLEASLLETLRFISHVPLAVPHATVCDTTICGKKIPKNTTVYINLWALHHDENFWEDPWKFKPERFLDPGGNVLPADHENRRRLMPFGAGRRVCLGESLAKNRLFLFSASLLQNFSFHPENCEELPELDPKLFHLGIVLHPGSVKVKAITRNTVINEDICGS